MRGRWLGAGAVATASIRGAVGKGEGTGRERGQADPVRPVSEEGGGAWRPTALGKRDLDLVEFVALVLKLHDGVGPRSCGGLRNMFHKPVPQTLSVCGEP